MPTAEPATGAATVGWHRVEQVMGTAIGLDLRAPWVPASVIDAAFDHLREIDARFSTYRPASEISRLARGILALDDCSPDVREVLERCETMRALSLGYFDVRATRTGPVERLDGGLDPSGFVKGWAVDAAAGILDAAGARNYCLNAGGDVLARGEAAPGLPWRVGIRHPDVPDRLATVVAVRELAVATSADYERPGHIVDPHTGRPPVGVLSVTVVGPNLAQADAYATAAFAMGADGLAWIAARPGHAGCMVTADRRLVWTPEFARYKVS
jgi:FAD:protein FMN transferase